MSDKNEFGGGNPNFIYTPMTDIEQEVIARLVESDELMIVLHGWGYMEHIQVLFGDGRVSIPIKLTFHSPEVPMDVFFFDLELRTKSGYILFREKQPTLVNGKPLQVCKGVEIEMIWDIGIRKLDPGLVKMIKPGAIGLTSRLIDRDTGDETFRGNMNLSEKQENLLRLLRQGEAKARQYSQQQVAEAETKAGGNGKS